MNRDQCPSVQPESAGDPGVRVLNQGACILTSGSPSGDQSEKQTRDQRDGNGEQCDTGVEGDRKRQGDVSPAHKLRDVTAAPVGEGLS